MKWFFLLIVLASSTDATEEEQVEQIEQVAQPELSAKPKPKPTIGDGDQPSQKKQSDERSITDIRRDLRNGLRAEATAKGDTTWHHDAIGTLINLHREIVRHSTFENGFALKESRALLQSRLVRIERDIRKRFDVPRDKDSTAKKRKVPARVDVDGQPALAQVGRQPGFGGQLGFGGNGQGGAGQLNGGGIAGQGIGGQLPDFGPDLAVLIQQVIDPDFWDVNGGPGTIVYFQPLKALVISATAEIHHNLAGVLGQLRAAP